MERQSHLLDCTMTVTSITLMSDAYSELISVGGAELPNSRRVVDLGDAQACRVQYTASNSITVRIEWSDDWGVTWHTLVPEYGMQGTNPRVSAWQVIPADALEDEVTIRAFAVGGGLITSVNFVEFQYR